MEPGQKGPITYKNNLHHFYLVLPVIYKLEVMKLSKLSPVMITSIETLNIPGMAAFSHNASWTMGLKDRSV
jgi:hypothetical protein